MRYDYKDWIVNTLIAILFLFFGYLAIYSVILRFKHPKWTETEIFLKTVGVEVIE